MSEARPVALPPAAMGRDLWLAAAAAVVALVALGLALRGGAAARAGGDVPPVATVQQATGEVKLRLAQTLGWTRAPRGSDVHDGDAVFVPPGAEATLAFSDGTELALDERSLVVVETPRAGPRSVTLRQGSLSGRVGAAGLTLNTPAGQAQLEAATEARVEVQGAAVEVAVKKGAARVKGSQGAERRIAGGQRVAAAATGTTTELPPWPVTLTAPEAQARISFRGGPQPVQLAWTGTLPPGARVQVARDRLFAFVELERDAAAGGLALPEPARGVTWWRVVDAAGLPLSEARRFTCAEDVAPVGMFPRNGEVLLAPRGTQVAFAWAPLPGISRYRLELSPSQGFEPIAEARTATAAEVRLRLDLNEGTWFWRVRVEDELGLGPPSEPLRFRVIHKGIPDAPELLNPEIEVSP